MRRTSWVLMVAGVMTLGYCGASLADTWFSQHRGESKLERHTETVSVDRIDKGDAIGRIEISRLGISAVIMEGSDETVLRRGVGHIPGTAFPGRSGNVGLAAHRDSFFRGLRNVRRNDDVILRTPRGEYRYRVVSTKKVAPKAVEVLRPTEEETVTLVTCFPFDFIGSAPERFIVHAVRIGAVEQPFTK
jgi:sortase A